MSIYMKKMMNKNDLLLQMKTRVLLNMVMILKIVKLLVSVSEIIFIEKRFSRAFQRNIIRHRY